MKSEKTKFKVGDEIVLIEHYGDFKLGDIFIVTQEAETKYNCLDALLVSNKTKKNSCI